ncbi:MAG TPA: exopolyphosphatase [Candidatus Aphodovivens excrementavium]|nr:exopolyphosphatase [Candidatus Aphodovivens excrementavium]
MPNYAVIDLGSNSVRMVVYEVRDDKKRTYTCKDFRSLINDKVMAGLAAYVEDGVFVKAGVKRAASVLKGHIKRSGYFQCKRIDIFATAVLRNASNCNEAVSAIEKEIGLPLSLLSARDEAHLGFVGATCDRSIERGTLIDIGGGSTELTRIENGKERDNVSLGQGSLSSYAQFVKDILPTPIEAQEIREAFWKHIDALPDREAFRAKTFYGIGGTVRAAAKMYAQTHGEGVRPKTLTPQQVSDILQFRRTDASAYAHSALKASAERIHTLTPGCIILESLLKGLGATKLEICKYGVREGYLIERMLAK